MMKMSDFRGLRDLRSIGCDAWYVPGFEKSRADAGSSDDKSRQ